jgi:hypothetical protein
MFLVIKLGWMTPMMLARVPQTAVLQLPNYVGNEFYRVDGLGLSKYKTRRVGSVCS